MISSPGASFSSQREQYLVAYVLNIGSPGLQIGIVQSTELVCHGIHRCVQRGRRVLVVCFDTLSDLCQQVRILQNQFVGFKDGCIFVTDRAAQISFALPDGEAGLFEGLFQVFPLFARIFGSPLWDGRQGRLVMEDRANGNPLRDRNCSV